MGNGDKPYAKEMTPLELETLLADMRTWPRTYLPKLGRLIGHLRFLENRERERQELWVKRVTPPPAKDGAHASPLERAKAMVRTGAHAHLPRCFSQICEQAGLFAEEIIEMVHNETRKPQP